MTQQGVLFDLDNTLLDRTNSLRDFINWQVGKMLMLPNDVADGFVERFIELDNNGQVWKDRVYTQIIQEYELADWAMEELLSCYELCFCAFCKPRVGAVSAIKSLHTKGLKIGLVSNGKSPFQERNFRALGLSDYFHTVVVSDAVGLRKPNKEIFALACSNMQVDLERCTMVGDNEKADIAGAKQAGMRTIHTPPAQTASTVAAADYTVYSLNTLINYF